MAKKTTPTPKVMPKKTLTPKKTPEKPGEERPYRTTAKVPVPERNVNLVKLMRKMKATSASSAVPLSKLADGLGYTTLGVYSLINGTGGKARLNPRCLRATGHVAVVAAPEKQKGLAAYLPPRGVKADLLKDVPFVSKKG